MVWRGTRPAAPLFLRRHRLLRLRRQPGFWEANGEFSTLAAWRDWGGPFVVFYGGQDEADNVPVSASVERLEVVPDDPDLSWRVFDGVGHGLTDDGGVYAEGFERALLGWLNRHTHRQEPADNSG